MTLVPTGEKVIYNAKSTLVKTKIKIRESSTIVMGSNYLYGRLRQCLFLHCVCSTTHESVKQTLPEVGVQLPNKEK